MSAERDFQNAYDTLEELYRIGHDLPDYVANSIIDILTRTARNMVNHNRMANGRSALRQPEVEPIEAHEEVRYQTPIRIRSQQDIPPNVTTRERRQVRPLHLLAEVAVNQEPQYQEPQGPQQGQHQEEQQDQEEQDQEEQDQEDQERLTVRQIELILCELFPDYSHRVPLYTQQIYDNYTNATRAQQGHYGTMEHQAENAIFEFNFIMEQQEERDRETQEIFLEDDDEDMFIELITERTARPWEEEWSEHKVNLQTVRAIGRKRFEAPCDEDCIICYERHIAGESIITDCGHEFGSQCWDSWMSNPEGNHSCPTCRKHLPHTLSFKLRADSRRRTVPNS
jgi:hypothetical protein